MREEFTLELRSPPGWRRLLWRTRSSWVSIEISEYHREGTLGERFPVPEPGFGAYYVRMGTAKWDTVSSFSIAPEGGMVRIRHIPTSGGAGPQEAVAEVFPHDVLVYEASWWRRPYRNLTPDSPGSQEIKKIMRNTMRLWPRRKQKSAREA